MTNKKESSVETSHHSPAVAVTREQLKSVKLKSAVERSPLKPLINTNTVPTITLKDISNVKLRSSSVTLRRSPRGHNSPLANNPSLKLRKVNKSPGGTPIKKDLKPSHISSPLLRAIQNKFKAANEKSPPSTPLDSHLW